MSTFLNKTKAATTREHTLGEGKLIYIPRWTDDPDSLYREAKKLSFTSEVIPQFGKAVEIKKRKTVEYGLPYAYSKTAKPSIEWEPLALAIKQKLEAQLGRTLQQSACNYYLDPEGYISAHSEKSTPVNGVKTAPNLIISVSPRQSASNGLAPDTSGL